LETLKTAFSLADNFNEQGLADYIAGRIDAHKKHDWMLKSIIK
jgi:DNA-binding ferritin-like protein